MNRETAQLAVLEYLKTNGKNVSDTARVFGINIPVLRNILRRQQEGDVRDRSEVPKHQPNKTAPQIEDQVIEVKNKTRMGPKRLSIYLKKYEEISVPAGTIPTASGATTSGWSIRRHRAEARAVSATSWITSAWASTKRSFDRQLPKTCHPRYRFYRIL